MKPFTVARYAPQPEIEIGRTLSVALAGAVTGVACGAAGALFTAYLFSFPIIFNAVIGVGIAMTMVKVNELAKVRVPLLMATEAIVAGVFAIGTLHYGDYLSFRSSLNKVPADKLEFALCLKAHDLGEAELPKAQLDRRPTDSEDIAYVELLQVESFPAYLSVKAKQGIELGRTGRAGGVNLGFGGTILYWVVEGLILIGIAVLIVWKESDRPFCEPCDRWMNAITIGDILADPKRVATLIEGGEFSLLALTQPGTEKTRVKLYKCDGCERVDENVVRVAKVTYHDGAEDESRVMDFTLSDNAVVALMKSLGHEADVDEQRVLQSVRDLGDESQAIANASPANHKNEMEAYVANLIKSQLGDR